MRQLATPAPFNALVLIADDEPEIRELCKNFLERFGYMHHAVGDGQLALDAVAAGVAPDIILSDVMIRASMALNSAVASKSRRNLKHTHRPMTGMNNPDDIVNGPRR